MRREAWDSARAEDLQGHRCPLAARRRQQSGAAAGARASALGLGFAVLAAPDDQGDQEGDEADGGDDHGQQHVLGRVEVDLVLQGAVVEVAVVALEDVPLCQRVRVAVVQVVGPGLQAGLQEAVGPGKRAAGCWERMGTWGCTGWLRDTRGTDPPQVAPSPLPWPSSTPPDCPGLALRSAGAAGGEGGPGSLRPGAGGLSTRPGGSAPTEHFALPQEPLHSCGPGDGAATGNSPTKRSPCVASPAGDIPGAGQSPLPPPTPLQCCPGGLSSCPTALYLLMTFHSHSSDTVTFFIRSTKSSQHFCVMLVYVSSAGERR